MNKEQLTPKGHRAPDLRDQELEPASCEVMPGHQHAVSDVEDLADSIAALGQLNAVQVIEYPDGRRYIAAGRRRWMACQALGLSLRADIWLCRDNEDVHSENLARAFRIAENSERRDPSAIDVAYQLRRIRNENNFSSAVELGAFVGMSESRVKRYLCVLQASDFLIETAQAKALPIKMVAELMRCEKQLGEPSARKLIKGAAEGTLSARELKKLRDKDKAPKRAPPKASAREFDAKLRARGDALLALIAAKPHKSESFARDFMAQISKLLAGADARSEGSPG